MAAGHTHWLVVIGYMSRKTCYLDLSIAAAQSEHMRAEHPGAEVPCDCHVSIVYFTERFMAYDVWEAD